MKLLVIILLTSACTTSSQQVPGSVKFLEQDAKVRRQAVSYSTSVIHQNPKHPDQHAQSSINVDFNPPKSTHQQQQQQQQLSRPIIQNQPSAALYHQAYNNLNHHHHLLQQQQLRRPKSQQAYANTNNIQVLQRHPQFSPSEETIQQTRQIYNNIQKLPTNYISPQSQSFNVGYSVSFTGAQKRQQPRTLSAQKLENAEIITGSRKEPVRKPTNEFDSNDFVNHHLIDLKKQKVSGIKPKLNKLPNNQKDNDAKNFIGNLAPKTQKYLSYLGDAKPIGSSNIRFRQQLQSSDPQTLQTNNNVKTSWTNLSPSVEIYHSKELPQTHAFSFKEQLEQSKYFDHAGALGKSQGFDYSNAVDAPAGPSTENNQLSLINSIQPHKEITENIVTLDDAKDLSSLYPVVYELGGDNLQQNPLVVPFSNNFETVLPLNNIQISHKAGEDQESKQQIQVPLTQSIDTSLLHEPLLLNGKNLPNDLHTVTIPFDTTLLQAMQQQQQKLQPVDSFDANKGQVQALQGNVGITEQYQGQLENLQVQPLQGIKQDNFQDPRFKQFQQTQQPQQQFNIYGSPHALFLKKDFDKYFEHNYDKMQPQESRYEGASLRLPKVTNGYNDNNSNNHRARQIKGKEIHMSLQPPPIIKITRHRRMFL